MADQHRVLFVGLRRDQASRYEEALQARAILLEAEPDPEAANRRLADERYNAVVALYPLPTGVLGRLISTVRTRSNQSEGAGLILLAPAASLRAARGLVGRGVYKALSMDENPVVLAIVVERTIELVQPMVERLSLQLPVGIRFATSEDEKSCRTENLCGGGMLVVTDTVPAVGTRFDFTLRLDESVITGEAQVVRRVATEQGPVTGFGARFCSFDEDGRSMLLAWLRSNR